MIIKKEFKTYGGHFEPEKKEARIAELENIMNNPNFWNDKRESEKIINESNNLKNKLEKTKNLKTKIDNNLSLLEELKNSNDTEIEELLENDLNLIKNNLEQLEIEILLNKPYDKLGAVLEIHPGAGGTESCDWALMLSRMYERWILKKGYKLEIIDKEYGEEAGIKSITMLVKGINAYGYLKGEKGVHRLVRISPFDSGARRHTSFASCDITPIFENTDIDIEIKETDIRVDVYRSSGKGGQGVNTTDSAVRITHLPTKIVVTCQNERSQIQNKATAMEVLKNKLYQLELEKRNKELSDMKGEYVDINFGSQIRSYVMHPYSLVKDHRTNVETSQVDKVLDGDIDLFINAYLKDVK
jgi:peptide chain release factor 2